MTEQDARRLGGADEIGAGDQRDERICVGPQELASPDMPDRSCTQVGPGSAQRLAQERVGQAPRGGERLDAGGKGSDHPKFFGARGSEFADCALGEQPTKVEAKVSADFECPLFGARARTACRIGLAGTRCSRKLRRTVVQAVSVEGDGLAAMHVAADDRLHQQLVAESIRRPYQSRGRDGSMPHGNHGPNGRNMAAGTGTRPGNDHAVSRCRGSEAGGGIALCIGRYIETEQGARIQTPGLAEFGQLTGTGRAPQAGAVCHCNVGDPCGIPRGVDRDAEDRGMERWRLVSLAASQSPHGHHDHGRSYDEADDARRHRGGGADSSFRCASHSQESG